MGTRLKTFNATGVATSGRIYAGDLNAIQDQYADQSNLAQTIGVGTIQVGESGLQVVRYGAGEMRITGAMRTDGILRGLGGLFAGTYTTTQRNAISSPPYGLLILNTTTNQFEWNAGTPSVPNWQAVAPAAAPSIPTGTILEYGAAAAPSGYLLCDGAAVSRTTYSALYAVIGTTNGAGDGSSTFNVPDHRGRVAVGIGTHADVSAIGNSEGVAVASRRPKHNTTIKKQGSLAPPSGQSPANPGWAGETGGGSVSSATFNAATEAYLAGGPQTGAEPLDTPAYIVQNFIIKT